MCMSDLQARSGVPQLNQWQATSVWPDVIAQMGGKQKDLWAFCTSQQGGLSSFGGLSLWAPFKIKSQTSSSYTKIGMAVALKVTAFKSFVSLYVSSTQNSYRSFYS